MTQTPAEDSCPDAYQSGSGSLIQCSHPKDHPPVQDGAGRYWRHGRGSMHWDRMADYQPPQDEFDVAVVVFCRTRAVDSRDAEDSAMLAVRNAIAGGRRVASVPLEIPLPPHLVEQGHTDPVQVATVTPLRYVGGQGIRLVATAEPYQNAGMGRPRKGAEG